MTKEDFGLRNILVLAVILQIFSMAHILAMRMNYYFIIFIPTALLLIAVTVLSAFSPTALIITVPVDLFVLYFFISPLFGYVELREGSLFIKYGFFLKKEIPYAKIRGAVKGRKFYSESMMSLKNSFEHVNVKYNSFDVTTVSVVENDAFISEFQYHSFLS